MVFAYVDWSRRGAYMDANDGISVRIIGWLANEKDQRIYREVEAHAQER